MKVFKSIFEHFKKNYNQLFSSDHEYYKFNILICAFIVLNTVKISVFNTFVLGYFWLLVISYKLFITVLIVTPLVLVILRMKSVTIIIIAYITQLIYIFTSLSYFLYFHSYLNIIQSYMLANEGYHALTALAIPQNPQLLICLLDLPLFIYIVLKFKTIKKTIHLWKPVKDASIILLLAIVILLEIFSFSHKASLFQLVGQQTVGDAQIIMNYGTLVCDIATSIIASSNDEKLINSFSYGSKRENTAIKKESPNFIIIQCESIDANVINKKYNDKYIAPYLNSLSNKSVYFPYTLSYHKAGGTSDAEFSILNSVEPLDKFPSIKLRKYTYPNSFVKQLFKSNYSVSAFHGNDGGYYNRNVAFNLMGFDILNDLDVMKLKHVGWGAPDQDMFNYVAKSIATQKNPFFYYTITMTSHGPFKNASTYYHNKDYDGISPEINKNFFNSVSYVDKSIEEFMSKIAPYLSNTYVFIYGDHTPYLRDSIYYQASYDQDNKYFEYVPLIIVTPDNKKHIETQSVASFLDIAPTILDLSGVKYSINTKGIDLLTEDPASHDIPFKGENYSRKTLFNTITAQNKSVLSK